MSTANLISEIEAQGVVFRVVQERILFNPADAISLDYLRQLRVAKAEALALIKVKQALGNGRRLKPSELLRVTDLDKDRLYGVLGELYNSQELGTNYDGYYWLVEPDSN